MTAPVDLSVVRAERKEKCEFCGKDEHQEYLMCRRVRMVRKYADASRIDIYLHDEEDPDDGAA